MRIILKDNIDNNALSVGDNVWHQAIDANGFSGTPALVGEVSDIGLNYVDIDVSYSTPANDDFIMFSKDDRVNKNSLLGYYAEIKLTNDSLDKAELFSLGSQVTQSSK